MASGDHRADHALVLVPVRRQATAPVILLAITAIAAAVDAVIRGPEIEAWWYYVVGVALIAVPAALTALMLRPERQSWKAASRVPPAAEVEGAVTTIRRFAIATLVAAGLVTLGMFTGNSIVLGCIVLGTMLGYGYHLGWVLLWERRYRGRLFGVVRAWGTPPPEVARAYWLPHQ